MAGNEGSDELRKELVKHVRNEIGPIAAPDKIQFCAGAAEDAVRQDHAPYPAQDRRG
jgi:DNA-binding transcriptional MocR family regulator